MVYFVLGFNTHHVALFAFPVTFPSHLPCQMSASSKLADGYNWHSHDAHMVMNHTDHELTHLQCIIEI